MAQTRWGPVQVRITVVDGKSSHIQASQVPEANFHEQQLNEYATSVLRDAAIEAQSADIDTVSGRPRPATGTASRCRPRSTRRT
ncbi:hypothetical protein Pa4123_41120 [Phytohabitans aurantiacus]|uniref:Uncharacterized protein n=1 Tax=Phytohabitans aurantiacus TaxID=3016789 RepID=A0ABQ5QX52_9ACTN|nr:hypothetical protein Pa4123_41120 [Phytohabitans aurantiacus]